MLYIDQFLVLISTLSIYLSNFVKYDSSRAEPDGYFNWKSIVPSKHLQWHQCYERHECARLELPMDPKNTSLHETVTVAILRDPVNISRSDPNYGGSIFFNPGGPGGSGIDYVRWAGYETHYKIEGPKRFDLIGFDPRGIGYSTPQPVCFDSELDRQLYWQQQSIVGLPDESEYALQYHYQAAKAFGQSCDSTIMQYMTTLLNIQDMLAIADFLEPDVKDPLINYWGMSYGTFIGNTLASVYPHRIGKFVLDAVVSSQDFVSNRWGYAIVDLELVHTKFYESCHTAGPSKCPLYEETVDLIRDKVDTPRIASFLTYANLELHYPIS